MESNPPSAGEAFSPNKAVPPASGGSHHARYRSETVVKERPSAGQDKLMENSAKRLPSIKMTPMTNGSNKQGDLYPRAATDLHIHSFVSSPPPKLIG